ncbi:MAG: type VI secretion system-associated FHA domain protein TagH [Novosphingobium sp.]
MNGSQPLALTLSIRNAARLDNGSPLALVLDRRSATIGRSPTTDWALPDPDRHISSRHCDVLYRNGGYELVDRSTNGTYLNGASERLAAPQMLQNGDVIRIGRYELVASLVPAMQTMPPPSAPPAAPPPPPPPPPRSQPEATPAPVERPAPAADDIWAKFAASNAVDWSRGGFGAPPPAPRPVPPPAPRPVVVAPPPPPAPEPVVIAEPAAPVAVDEPELPAAEPAPEAAAPQDARPVASEPVEEVPIEAALAEAPIVPAIEPAAVEAAPPEPAPVEEAAPAEHEPAPVGGGGLADLLYGAELPREQIKQEEGAALVQAGMMLRRLIAGMVVMLEARARAKSQMGAQGTGLEIEGNNPLKFARSPEQALQYMLNPQERGFMSAERAIEDSFRDLQAHQLATLRAMQGALRATLERFSPKAIRDRAEGGGLMAKILPSSRDAALWAAYQKEFSGVAFNSDEAFMDMFSKEFRLAYDEISRQK